MWLHRKVYIRNLKSIDEGKEPSPSPDDLDLLNSNINNDMYQEHINESDDVINQDHDLFLIEDKTEDELNIIDAPEDDLPSNDKYRKYRFGHGHPQRLTHYAKLSDESKGLIPNMVPSLPRSDKGDRSYYCSTMLILFKPWRHGLDLKKKQTRTGTIYLTCMSLQSGNCN